MTPSTRPGARRRTDGSRARTSPAAGQQGGQCRPRAGQAGQAASTLGNLGANQLAAEQGIIGTQNQYGAMQQQAEQQKIDQAIKNYAMQQEAPMQSLAQMSGLLRGLPLETKTTQSYQAGPGALQSLAGIGTGIAGITSLAKAGGGTVKSYAKGGIASYEGGGDVMSEENAKGIAQDLTADQMQQVQPRTLPDYIRIPLLNQKIEEQIMSAAARETMHRQTIAEAQLLRQTTAGNRPAKTPDLVQIKNTKTGDTKTIDANRLTYSDTTGEPTLPDGYSIVGKVGSVGKEGGSAGGLGKIEEAKLSAKYVLLKEYDRLIEDYKKNQPSLSSGQRKALLAAKTMGFPSAVDRVMELGRTDPKNNPNAPCALSLLGSYAFLDFSISEVEAIPGVALKFVLNPLPSAEVAMIKPFLEWLPR